MKYPSLILTVALLLSGCTHYTQEQVAAMPDGRVCSSYLKTMNYTEETDAYLASEVRKRNLDCHPDHWTCASHGHSKGTEAYAKCRMELQRMAAEQQQMDQFMSGLQTLKRTKQETQY